MKNISIKEVCREIPSELRKKYGEAALFIAYDCLLIEKETGKGYSYRALNIKTGKSEIISRRKNPLTTSCVGAIVEKMRVAKVVGQGIHEADRQSGENALRDKLAKIQQHIFDEVLPQYGYGIREQQIELAKHILDTIGKRAISLAEAETGTGKTHAYLIAAALAKRGRINDFWLRDYYKEQSYAQSAHKPFVITTSSIALQKAIARDYIPEISRMLMEHGIIKTPLSGVIRKGKRHYVCEKNLITFYDDADARTKQLLTPLMQAKVPIDLGDADKLSNYIKRRIGISGRCSIDCPYRASCRYLRHMDYVQSSEHDFQICNHNYFLADLKRRSNNESPLIPHYQGVIIDEAHKFLDAARQMYGFEMSPSDVEQTAYDIYSIKYKSGVCDADVHELVSKLTMQNKRLFMSLNQSMVIPENDCEEAERYKINIGLQAAKNLRNMSIISDELYNLLSNRAVRRRYEGIRAQALWQLSEIKRKAEQLAKPTGLIYWLEKPRNKEQSTGGDTLVCATPKNLNKLLHHDLWSKNLPIVLTSGTLSAAGDFSHIKRKTGLDLSRRLREISVPSPFDYAGNALMYISENTIYPNIKSRRYIKGITDETERLIKAAHGHTAVLFTSYKAMDMVYEQLVKRKIGFPLFRLDRGNSKAIEQFKASGNGVLFASGALWEGIDIPGDILSMLIIVKLPFAVPDPISEYEQTLYHDMDEYKRAIMIPEMLVKLKQGVGRLIRMMTDTGVIALLDCRVNATGAYRHRTLTALHKCPVTNSISVVVEFFKRVKEKGYFSLWRQGA